MKIFYLSLWLLIILFQCNKEQTYDPDASLTEKEKDRILMSVIRYLAKAPENVSNAEIFDNKYDAYYQQRASQCRFEKYLKKADEHFFLISQPAPSLTEKRHATGGRVVFDSKGNLVEYEEVFRTWKLVPDTLRKRSAVLFEGMVKGESLEPYLTKNSQKEYIEFPDDRTIYNKARRIWETK